MAANFLREVIHPPRASQFLAIHPGNLNVSRLQTFIDDVWADLLVHIADPINIIETPDERVVEVFGTARYCIRKDSGCIRVEQPIRGKGNTVAFAVSSGQFSADLPFLRTGVWMAHYLYRWQERLGEALIDHCRTGDSWLATVQRILWKSVLRSTYWKRFRYALRNALALDTEVIGWCRKGRSRHHNQCVTFRQYNRALAHRAAYAQIAHDNPNLIWLYTFMLDEEIPFPSKDTISAIKKWLAQSGVTPAGWRLLANGCERDFVHVRDWIGPESDRDARTVALVNWLIYAPTLRLRQPLRGALLRLFLHDSFGWFGPGGICFRNIRISLATLNVILAEAERRRSAGSLRNFVEKEVVDVMTWLEAQKPVLDKNQLRAGWPNFVRQAARWKADCDFNDFAGPLKWESCLPSIVIGPWTILPLANAWVLREEALRQHHCADLYIRECLNGKCRIFSVRNLNGNRVATIGIERDGNGWKSFGIRGLANAPVAQSLRGLDQQIVMRYTDVWRLGQPVSLSAGIGEGTTDDAAALRRLEDRLGTTIDAEDPMLPAAILMERALMKMMGEPRSA